MVFIQSNSPAYWGVVTDLRQSGRMCRNRQAQLDGFDDLLRRSAIEDGIVGGERRQPTSSDSVRQSSLCSRALRSNVTPT
jgi:hypothetical protein